MQSLQWILAHSWYAKLLAVRRVTSNKGKNTPGIDGVVWKTSRQKMQAATQMCRRGYRALPLRRVYIPKKTGKLRPLGIPAMRDRAMQALYALTLQPIAESWADPNSYGFRHGRSCADAIAQVFIVFARKISATWVLEADIASCFDCISHRWIQDHISVDKKMLTQWLKAGFLDKGKLYPTLAGTPQGGIISPLIMNMTLDGLEHAVKSAVPACFRGTSYSTGVNVIRYADDFIVSAKTEELLRDKVLPAVRSFLSQRGLSLSEEKTRITRINEGFDFLGQRVRKHKSGKFIIQPTRKSVQGLQERVRQILKAHRGDDTWSMIRRLNQTIRGWCNYHRHVCSSHIFNWFDHWLFKQVYHWLHLRHPNKGRRWIVDKYYRQDRENRWTFYATAGKSRDGKKEYRELIRAGRTKIVRHVKVRATANPYDPAWTDYFAARKTRHRGVNRDGRFVEEHGWL